MSSVNQKISLFIPHIFANLSKELVTEVLEYDYKIGKISHIDFVEKTGADGKPYNAAYVHFEYWNEDMETLQFQQEVLRSEKGYRVVYDTPWFWIVLENKKKPRQVAGYRKPRLDLSETPTEETTQHYPGLNPYTDTTNYRLEKPAYDISFPELSQKQCVPESTTTTKESDCTNHDVLWDFFPELSIRYQQPWVPEKSLQELVQEQQQEFNYEEWEECGNHYTEEDYAHMDEMEDENDGQLVSIDGRYVKSLEEELLHLKMCFQQTVCENQRLQSSLYAETSKSQALAKAFMILDSKSI